jgi:hypothetical protein
MNMYITAASAGTQACPPIRGRQHWIGRVFQRDLRAIRNAIDDCWIGCHRPEKIERAVDVSLDPLGGPFINFAAWNWQARTVRGLRHGGKLSRRMNSARNQRQLALKSSLANCGA